LKAHRSDVFVILDSVQFPRGTTWMSRNRFKNDQGTLWLTVPVWKKGLGLQRIHEVRICHEFHWVFKHLASLKSAYARAPYFADHISFIENTYLTRYEKLIELNRAIIDYLLRQLKIDTQIKLLSELGIQSAGNQMLVEICQKLGASTYLAQVAAAKYLNPILFDQAGIKLRFLKSPTLVYPQLWGAFIANLSALDLLFNCGPRAHNILTTG
ncbi:MAG: WbqC family protein, partial [Desulfobacterales bacterium]